MRVDGFVFAVRARREGGGGGLEEGVGEQLNVGFGSRI